MGEEIQVEEKNKKTYFDFSTEGHYSKTIMESDNLLKNIFIKMTAFQSDF